MDWLDKKLGNFCKSIQKEIDELPFLSRPQKKKFIDMLNDCAQNAEEASEVTNAAFNRGYKKFQREFERQTGHSLPQSKVA